MISVDDLFNIDLHRNDFGISISTPNFDRLKAMGVSFSNANASVALCNPSRTAILTGQNPFETGVHSNSEVWHQSVDPSSTIPGILHDAGYTTMGFGKLFHTLAMPLAVRQAMFDQYFCPTSEAYGFEEEEQWGELTGDPDATGDALVVDAALAALAAYTGTDPLLLMVGLVDPHLPFLAPQQFLDLYPLEDIVVPDWDGTSPPPYLMNFLQTESLQDLIASGELTAFIQGYLANISEMDHRLGLLLDGIAASGLDPTIMLYSDHGYHLGDHDTIHKFTVWEQAANAPLIIYHPDTISAGDVHDGVVSLLDIAPTLLEIAGIAIPPEMEGHSLLPSVLDTSEPTFGVAVTTMGGSFSIRTADWRYNRYQDGSEELFDVALDPDNSNNVVTVPANAAELVTLRALLDAKLLEMGVDFDALQQLTVFEEGNGNSQYFVTDQTNISLIADSGGSDTFYISSNTFTLPAWAERLITLAATAATLTGNALANLIAGSNGGDTIDGLGGNDRLVGALGDDVLSGGAGNDSIDAGKGVDTVFGGDGDDSVLGKAGADLIDGGAGNDSLEGGLANDVIIGGAGNDTLLGEAGDDSLRGDGGDDSLFGSAGIDALVGGAGADVLNGGAGDDSLNGGAGIDRLVGGDGVDVLLGSLDADVLLGGIGNDVLNGGDGNDRLFGEGGNDRLVAEAGNDYINGGGGNDVMFGGAGQDRFVWTGTDTGSDVVRDYVAGSDAIVLQGVLPGDVAVTFDAGDTLISFNAQTIRLTSVTVFDPDWIIFA